MHDVEVLQRNHHGVDFVQQHLEPQFAGLMHHDEQQLVGMFGLRLRRLQAQQLLQLEIVAIMNIVRFSSHGNPSERGDAK